MDYYYDSTLTPIYFAVKNNNFEIANVLLKRGVDINLLNIYQGNILSFLLVDFINKENLKYIIDKNVDINYNLYCNNVDSLLSFSNKKESELNICNYFQSKWTNKNINGINITCFDYLIYEGLINGKIKLLNLLEGIIQYKNFDLNKINEVSIELIIINKKNKIIEDIIRYKKKFISYEFCNTIIKNAILNNNTECLILILKVVIYFKEYDIKKLYNGKTTMSIFIENFVDDEGIYNMLFNKGAFIDMKYLRNGKNKSSSFIVKNKGLIKSIIRNGFYIVRKNKLVLINTPLIYFIKNYNNDLVEKLLEDGASIEETDENGMTPIFYTINTNNRKIFKLIIEKYKPNVNKKNKLGQTPLIVAQQLEKNKDNNRAMYISLLENYIKHNEVFQNKKENNKAILLNSLQEKNYDTSRIFATGIISSGNSLSIIQKESNIFLLLNSIKEKGCNPLKKLLMDNKDINVNKRFNGKTIMSTLIDNIVNDEELFNMLFERGGYLDIKYFSEKKFYNLIIKNPGLIKSINRMGFMVRRKSDLVSIPIKQPIIFFIKCSKNELVQLLLKYGGSVNEVDNEGTTLILQSIKSNNIKIFKILLEKYHPDTSIKNKLGQTPLNYARNLKKNSNRGHEILRKEFISTLENYNEKMINLSSSTVKASSSTSSSTAKKTKLSVEEMIKEIKNLNSSNPTSSKTIPTTSTPLKTNLSMEKMVSENKNLNSNNPTSSTIIPIPINKELKKILEKQLIQDKPKNLDEVNDNKENIDYYLDNGVINNSNNEDEAALILNDEEWNENEEKIIDEIKNYDYFDEDNLN